MHSERRRELLPKTIESIQTQVDEVLVSVSRNTTLFPNPLEHTFNPNVKLRHRTFRCCSQFTHLSLLLLELLDRDVPPTHVLLLDDDDVMPPNLVENFKNFILTSVSPTTWVRGSNDFTASFIEFPAFKKGLTRFLADGHDVTYPMCDCLCKFDSTCRPMCGLFVKVHQNLIVFGGQICLNINSLIHRRVLCKNVYVGAQCIVRNNCTIIFILFKKPLYL